MARITTTVTDFAPGMSSDIRSTSGFARVQHFRVFPHKLVPEFSSEANESKALDIVKFVYAPWLTSGAYGLFGLGVPSGNSRAAIYFKTGGSLITDGWGTPNDNEASSGGARSEDVFLYYKLYLYGFSGGTTLWRYGDLASGLTFTESYQSISYTTVVQPVHHKSDDCAYFFADNKVYRLNGASWEGLVLTLPDHLKITSGEEQGNYLVIACAPKSGIGGSVTFHWDRDSSLVTVTDRRDWGEGDLTHIANLDGVLIGVTDFYTSSAFGHTSGSVIIKPLGGEWQPRVFQVDSTDTATLTGNKFVVDGKLHFPMRLRREGGTWEGIWAVNKYGNVTIPVSEEEVTTGRIQGIYKTGNYWWIAHSNDGSVNRTDDQNVYSYTSILETNVFGNKNDKLHFVGATIPFEPLPSGASVTLEWKKIGTSSWTAMKTMSTTGATTLSAIKDSNDAVPVFNEAQYRVKSTGGAVITSGLEFIHEGNSQKPYGR